MKLKKLTTVILSAALAVSALGAVTASAYEPRHFARLESQYVGISQNRGYGRTSEGTTRGFLYVNHGQVWANSLYGYENIKATAWVAQSSLTPQDGVRGKFIHSFQGHQYLDRIY